MLSATGGEIFVRKAPACTVIDLAHAMARKYGKKENASAIKVVGIRPGEKIHEVLVNEYEMQRMTEDDTFFTIHPEYRLPKKMASRTAGEEYTSENTARLGDYEAISTLLDAMESVESFL